MRYSATIKDVAKLNFPLGLVTSSKQIKIRLRIRPPLLRSCFSNLHSLSRQIRMFTLDYNIVDTWESSGKSTYLLTTHRWCWRTRPLWKGPGTCPLLALLCRWPAWPSRAALRTQRHDWSAHISVSRKVYTERRVCSADWTHDDGGLNL